MITLPQKAIGRIAPTPSGYLHLGNVFNFLLTWILVRKCNGILHLRIDDMDALRVKPEYLQDIFNTLNWLNINYDKGPKTPTEQTKIYSQPLRMVRYKQVLQLLVERNLVYACNCSRRQIQNNEICKCTFKNLAANTPNCSLKLPITTDKHIVLNGKNIPLTNASDFVVWRKDNLPAYQLTSVTDDMDNDINLIVRGADLFDSTCMQVLLADALNWQAFKNVNFIHHPLITDIDGNKLSKSAGALSIKQMRENGYSATDIYREFAKWLNLPNTNINSINDLLEVSDEQLIHLI